MIRLNVHNRLLGIVVTLTLILAIVWFSRVDNTLTFEDGVYIEKFLTAGGVDLSPTLSDYPGQLAFVAAVQAAVVDSVAPGHAIPFGHAREPRNVFTRGRGDCYDRSRVIEKTLRKYGLKTRHLALYSTRETKSKLVSLLTPGTPSHAATEVLTDRGWLVVDSNHKWLSLSSRNEPVSLSQIQRDVEKISIEWSESNASMNPIYREPFTFVYGLYSRHGQFFPPYTILPDVNYSELVSNFNFIDR